MIIRSHEDIEVSKRGHYEHMIIRSHADRREKGTSLLRPAWMLPAAGIDTVSDKMLPAAGKRSTSATGDARAVEKCF